MGCDGDNPVPCCSLQYGMDLTVYMAIIEDLDGCRPESDARCMREHLEMWQVK